MKKFSTNVLAEVAIFAALSFVLDILQGGICRGVWISGGSIGLAMIPVVIICYRRGFLAGLLCGLAAALIGMLGGIYTIPGIDNPWWKIFIQVCLDYVLAYPCVAAAGLFYKPFQNSKSKKERIIWIAVGTFIGGMLKFMSHFLAGAIFWQSIDNSFMGVTGDLSYLYSLVYNGSYMFPNIIITIVLVALIDLKLPTILSIDYYAKTNNKVEEVKNV